MIGNKHLLYGLLLLSWLIAPIACQAFISIDPDGMLVCPATGSESGPPRFTEANCSATSLLSLNPQDRDIWLKADLIVPAGRYSLADPLAIFIHAKAASLVYLNGKLIGNNGMPGADVKQEIPGRMDVAIPIPTGVLRVGNNQIIIRMSSHHGYLPLARPVHAIGLGKFRNPTDMKLRHYWPTLLPLGAMLLAAMYMWILALNHRDWSGAFCLSLMSLFSAMQLFVEVSRGIFDYEYPFHDVRLILILLFAGGFGLCLLIHIVARMLPGRQQIPVLSAAILISIGLIYTREGFDGKAVYAILVPAAVSLIVAGISIYKKRPLAIQFFISLAVFCFVMVIAPSEFLDVYFFYVVAGLLLFLAVQQANVLSREQSKHQAETARADQLQLIIDQNLQQSNPGSVEVKSAGKVDLIAINRIAYCKGAGDYVELNLIDGSRILHYDNLIELENSLPATFLRVHRSYIVNTALIRSLERSSSGVGRLKLSNNDIVPVSRRVMPRIRKEIFEVNINE